MASTLQPYPAASKTETEAFYFICGQTPHVVGASLSPSHSGDFPVPSAVVSSNKHRAPSSPSLSPIDHPIHFVALLRTEPRTLCMLDRELELQPSPQHLLMEPPCFLSLSPILPTD